MDTRPRTIETLLMREPFIETQTSQDQYPVSLCFSDEIENKNDIN